MHGDTGSRPEWLVKSHRLENYDDDLERVVMGNPSPSPSATGPEMDVPGSIPGKSPTAPGPRAIARASLKTSRRGGSKGYWGDMTKASKAVSKAHPHLTQVQANQETQAAAQAIEAETGPGVAAFLPWDARVGSNVANLAFARGATVEDPSFATTAEGMGPDPLRRPILTSTPKPVENATAAPASTRQLKESQPDAVGAAGAAPLQQQTAPLAATAVPGSIVTRRRRTQPILTGPQGVLGPAEVQKKTLLGG